MANVCPRPRWALLCATPLIWSAARGTALAQDVPPAAPPPATPEPATEAAPVPEPNPPPPAEPVPAPVVAAEVTAEAPAPAPAPEAEAAAAAAAPEASPLSLSMFADAYFAYQTGEPGTLATSTLHRAYVGQGPTGLAENGFSLSWLGFDAVYDGGTFGATGSLRFGSSMPIFHTNNPIVGIDNITQGFVTWKPVEALALDLGMFGTIFGAEVGESWRNLNYTRGALYYYGQPFWHTGLRAAYSVNEQLTLTGMLVNGTNNISETVQADGGTDQTPTVAAQIKFAPNDSFTIIGGGMLATDMEANDDVGFDTFFDLVATASLGDLSIVLNGDYIITKAVGDAPDDRSFFGLSGGLGYALTEQVGIAGRVEYLSDDGGNPDGDPWTLTTATATLDVRPAPNLIIRLDGRMELSSQDVFGTLPDGLDGMPVASPDASDQWFMGALGVVVTTDP
jgi:hypothetical protein